MARSSKKEKLWLEAKRTCVTATDLAPIMGIEGAYGSPLEVYQFKKNLLEPRKGTRQQEAGIRFEGPILEWYADNQQQRIIRYELELMKSEQYPFLGASLDARHLLDGDVLGIPVDAKNVRYRDPRDWGEDGSPDVPARYIVQLHAQMTVTGQSAARLAVLFSGHDLGWFHVEKDPEIEAGVIEAAQEFWAGVEAGVEPPVDGSDAWSKWLASRRKKVQVEWVEGPQADLAAELHRVYVQLAEVEARKSELANLLKQNMGDAEVVVGPFGRISFAFGHDRAETDHEAYAKVLEGRLLELDTGAGPFIEKIRKQLTSIKPASRTFRPTWKE